MKKYTLTIALLFISRVSYGEPIYLDCYVADEEERQEFTVKVDEETGKINHTRKRGSGFNADGFFASNEITYQEIVVIGRSTSTRQFRINRTNLSIKETITLEAIGTSSYIGPRIVKYSGTCTIVEVKDRKI